MFLEELFPQCPSFGYSSEPDYSVTPMERASGVETRNRNWQYPLHRFSCTVGPRAEEDIAELLEFWHAVGGMAYGFRFNDGVDNRSCRIHETITSLDCPLPAATAGYQLTKRYTFGARYQDRPIYKPVQGTILIADGGVLQTETTDYTIDYTTGIVTWVGTPSGALTWGGEFDVPVRFDSTFPVELLDRKIQSVAFTLKELRRANIT